MYQIPDYVNDDFYAPYLPWKPAQGEPKKAANAYLYYMALGPRRTYTAVSKQLKISTRSILRYSQKYNWKERVYLFDKIIYRLKNDRDSIDYEMAQDSMYRLRLLYHKTVEKCLGDIFLLLDQNQANYNSDNSRRRIAFISKSLLAAERCFKMTKFDRPKNLTHLTELNQERIKKEFNIEDLSLLREEKEYIYFDRETYYNPHDPENNLCFSCPEYDFKPNTCSSDSINHKIHRKQYEDIPNITEILEVEKDYEDDYDEETATEEPVLAEPILLAETNIIYEDNIPVIDTTQTIDPYVAASPTFSGLAASLKAIDDMEKNATKSKAQPSAEEIEADHQKAREEFRHLHEWHDPDKTPKYDKNGKPIEDPNLWYIPPEDIPFPRQY